MKNECVICKDCCEELQSLVKERIYRKYRYHEFFLCYKHSVEFFKLGQEQFILKYSSIAKEHEWLDEGKNKKSVLYF
ncbi:MAG: hypothetical protein WDA09_02760 [Bacteriovoracaceae bacterium]